MKYIVKYNQNPICEVHLEDTPQIDEAIEKLLDGRGLCGYFDKKAMFFRILAEYIVNNGWLPNFRKDDHWDAFYNVSGIKIDLIKEKFDFSKVQIEDEFIFYSEPPVY